MVTQLTHTTLIRRIYHYLFDIRETKTVAHSLFHRLTEKVPLLMAMYVSSVLVGISTYNTFPDANAYLRYSAAIIGGAAFDVILTVAVFSIRKNVFSILTIVAALITGLSIALDLYMSLNLTWLHATYIVMATLFALHLATTRGLNLKEIESRLSNAEHTSSRLQQTNTILNDENGRLHHTVEDLTHTNTDLENTLSNYKESMLEKLATKTDLTANEIVAVIGGDRNRLLEQIRQYRN